MIDVPMHLKSYPKNYQPHPQDEVVELDCLVMTSPRQFFLLLPSKVFGYSMSTKRWGKFHVPSRFWARLVSQFQANEVL
jgi:hypothetical protein